MDIVLRIAEPGHELALVDVYPEDSHPSFRSRIVLRVEAFRADYRFWVERYCVVAFLDAVRAMDGTLQGEARLQPLFESDFVHLRLTKRGGVVVTGELGEADSNHLRFKFETDQTCLRPLVADLQQLLESTAPAG